MHVKINTSTLTDEVVSITDEAAQAVRMGFNPSAVRRVDRLKALAAAFISECKLGQAELPEGSREFAVAVTNMQTASMWGVLAATTNAK